MIIKTFENFLATDAGKQACNPAIHERLAAACPDINSCNRLKQWARERWPDHFDADPRKSTGKPNGKDAMERLWADYLAWAEEA